MELAKKAYKIAFPELFEHSGDFWNDPEQYCVIYGESQKKAVNQYCLDMAEHWEYFELKKAARTRRFKDKDLFQQPMSKIILELSTKQIDHLLHSLGVVQGGVCPDKFYRNYSLYYTKNEDCETLVKMGLMSHHEKRGSHIYTVTEKGITEAKTLLLITKEPETLQNRE